MAIRAVQYEQGPIRPPNEANSLLIRLTRNCPWNRCLFCPVYKGQQYSRRSIEEIKGDIGHMAEAADRVKLIASRAGLGGEINRETASLIHREEPELLPIAYWLYGGGKNVFLQDGDSLLMPARQLIEIFQFLKEKFPTIERITTYARTRTLLRFAQDDLECLKNAGLSRIHVGLESGSDAVLNYMKKGVTGAQHVEAGLRVKAAGLSLSFYVILGLGGQNLWRGHAVDTAGIINLVDPDYIRLRTLAIHPASPLHQLYVQGDFAPLSDDEAIREELLLIENLQGITSNLVSDHILNLLEEVQGKLPEARDKIIATLKRYLDWPEEKRALFRLGRRTGYLRTLADLDNPSLRGPVEDYYRRLQRQQIAVDEEIKRMMLRFI